MYTIQKSYAPTALFLLLYVAGFFFQNYKETPGRLLFWVYLFFLGEVRLNGGSDVSVAQFL